MLVYPCVDIRMQTHSIRKYTDTPMCNSRDMAKYIKLYVPHLEKLPASERVYVSPAEAASLEGMPPAYVETAEFRCFENGGMERYEKAE